MRTEDTERTLTSAQLEEARGWLEDCFGEELPADLSDLEVTKAVDHHYEGGLEQFVRDVEAYLIREYCPMCEYLRFTHKMREEARG